MRHLRILAPLAFLTLSGILAAQRQPVDFADPMVGTDAHGHAFPGATVPFGMVQLSPDTRTDSWDGCSGYHYSDGTIMGFSHTHLSGTGAGCLGDILLMPTVGTLNLDPGKPGNGYISKFSHSHEIAQPGYYRVRLDTPGVTAELTATEHAGFHRYTFPTSPDAHIVLDLLHGIQNGAKETALKVESETTLSGYRRSDGWGGQRTAYFVIRFSQPFSSVTIRKDADLLPAGTTEARGLITAGLNFDTRSNARILVKVGISATGVEGARKNLDAEIPGWDFSGVRLEAKRKWNQALGSVDALTADPRIERTFYSNLYLSCLAPCLFNDADGSYWGMDHKVHPNQGFQNYTTFSLWDTHRALHPLLTLLQPQRVNSFVRTLLAEYSEYGRHTTPIWPLWGNETWCMIGYHSVPVIVDAYFKGFKGFAPRAAYEAMRDTAMQNRSGLGSYKKLGYDASRQGECATSKTLEYAYDDWCLAQMAASLGYRDDAEMFTARAANYRNVFDATTEFMRGRKADGSWRAPFDTRGLVNDEYTEADAWQYAFFAPQDVPGLISLYGGDSGFVKRLDELFNMDSVVHSGIPDISGLIGQYSQGDEQCHGVAYLYDFAGAPWKTQMRAREVMSKEYGDKPDGECGNVDCGQMAAWYVFSALGFYPTNPVGGVYTIGSPSLDKATIHVGTREFTVIAVNNRPRNVYIQSAELNGKPLRRDWLKHQEILAGGTLRLVMGPKPNLNWSADLASRPPRTMPAGFRYAALPAPSSNKPVVLTLPIRVVCGLDDPVGEFVPDPNMVDGAENSSDVRVDTSAPDSGPAGIYRAERYGQRFTYRFPVPKDKSYRVLLHFAEIFDESAGMRIENVKIDGKQALKDFDVFAAAGGFARAVTRKFDNVQPNPDGTLTIEISATPNSPDQNAKISGIEILPE